MEQTARPHRDHDRRHAGSEATASARRVPGARSRFRDQALLNILVGGLVLFNLAALGAAWWVATVDPWADIHAELARDLGDVHADVPVVLATTTPRNVARTHSRAAHTAPQMRDSSARWERPPRSVVTLPASFLDHPKELASPWATDGFGGAVQAIGTPRWLALAVPNRRAAWQAFPSGEILPAHETVASRVKVQAP